MNTVKEFTKIAFFIIVCAMVGVAWFVYCVLELP